MSLRMKQSTNQSSLEQSIMDVQTDVEIIKLYYLEHLSMSEISKKKGLSISTLYRKIHNFEASNPKIADQMQKKGKEITPEDYRKLQAEVSRLQGELKREKLRADFYEEMVAFGKEVYGIDLKKTGTK